MPFAIVPVLVLVAIIGLIIFAVRSRGNRGLESTAADVGMGTVKRLYFYGVAFVSLLMAANGVALLVRSIVDRVVPGRVITGDLTTQLSLGMALTIVGTPLWLVHWSYIQRQVGTEPAEVASPLRKLYTYLVLMVSMVFMVIGVVALLEWAFRSNPAFPAYRFGALVAWTGLWMYHWRLERQEGQPTPDTQTLRRWYIYLTVTYGLWLAAVGLGSVINGVLLQLYNNLAPGLVLEGQPLWSTGMRTSVAIALTGSLVWMGHWLYVARGDVTSTLRQVYLNIFGLLPGVLTMLASMTFILFLVLSWALGATEQPAWTHFRALPRSVAALLVGVALAGYHWSVVQQESSYVAGRLLAARRAYTYVMSGLGLGTLATAVIIVTGTILGFLIAGRRGLLTNPDWWRDPIALVLTLIIIGVPLYGYYWGTIQRRIRAMGREERAALSRRIFVYLVLGIAMLGLLGSASHLLFLLLRGALQGDLSVTVLRDARWSVGIVAAAGMVLPYYWQVLREDREAGAEERVTRKAVTVVAGEFTRRLVPELETVLGQRVRVVRVLELEPEAPALSPDWLTGVAEHVAAAPGHNVLLLLVGGRVQVLSYD